jgi:hypothetical protein
MKKPLFVLFAVITLYTGSFGQKNYRIVDGFRVPSCINNVKNMEIDEKGRFMVAGNFLSGPCLVQIDFALWDEHSRLSRLNYHTGDYDLTYSSFIGDGSDFYDFKYLHGKLRYFDYAGWPLILKENGNIDSSVWYTGPILLTGGINDIAEDKHGGYIMTGVIGHFDDPSNAKGTIKVCYRLNEDLSVDTTFLNPTAGPAPGIQNAGGIRIVPYTNDTYLVTGTFTWYGDYFSPCIVRIFEDGSIDTSFQSPFASKSVKVLSLLVQPDGKVWVSGWLYENDDDDVLTEFLGIVRLMPNGDYDNTVDFRKQFGDQNGANSIFQLPNGNIIWGGRFEHFHGVPRGGIAMTDPDGNLILDAFNGPGFKGPRLSNPEGPGTVSRILQLGGDTLMIGGTFLSFDGSPANSLIKIVPISTSATQQINSKLIKAFPNPVSNILQIELPDIAGQGGLEIFHIDGKLMYTNNVIYNNFNVDVSNWPNAVYIVKIITSEYTVSKRVVVFR